jgi:hypothetical protein
LLACRRISDEIELRLVESGGRPGGVEITVQQPITTARLTDLRGETLPDPVGSSGCMIRFDCEPWQLRTVRLRTGRVGPGPV